MILQKQLLYAFLIAMVWIQQSDGIKGPNVSGPKFGTKDYAKMEKEEIYIFYTCYRDILCYFGPEAREELHKAFRETTLEILNVFYETQSAHGLKCETKEFIHLADSFCEASEEDKEKVFETTAPILSEHVSEICAQEDQQELCQKYEELGTAVAEKIEKYIANGKCKYETL